NEYRLLQIVLSHQSAVNRNERTLRTVLASPVKEQDGEVGQVHAAVLVDVGWRIRRATVATPPEQEDREVGQVHAAVTVQVSREWSVGRFANTVECVVRKVSSERTLSFSCSCSNLIRAARKASRRDGCRPRTIR